MSDGSTLWALRYAEEIPKVLPMHYYPGGMGISDYWVAASEPVDTLEFEWVEVPNYTLVTLVPNQPPQFSTIIGADEEFDRSIRKGINLIYPNPFTNNTDISWQITCAKPVELRIYDAKGSLVRNLYRSTPDAPQPTRIIWDGTDERGNPVPSGIYFCNLIIENTDYSRKIVLIK
jgi:hypothetical protein